MREWYLQDRFQELCRNSMENMSKGKVERGKVNEE